MWSRRVLALVLVVVGCGAKAPEPATEACRAPTEGPRVAVSVHVVEPTGGPGCGVSEHTANLPEVEFGLRAVDASSHVTPLLDVCSGEVSCRVADVGDAWEVEANVAAGPYRFRFATSLPHGATSAAGTLEEDDTEVGVRLVPLEASPCTYSIASAAGERLGVAPGTLWARISCPALVEPTNVGLVCSASDADVYLEGCAR